MELGTSEECIPVVEALQDLDHHCCCRGYCWDAVEIAVAKEVQEAQGVDCQGTEDEKLEGNPDSESS